MLIIKATDEAYDAVEAAIKELHSYDLPEILAFDIKRGEESFLHWIHACGGGGEADPKQEEG